MNMPMTSVRSNQVKVVNSVERRSRWSPEEKLESVNEANEPVSYLSLEASQHGRLQLYHQHNAVKIVSTKLLREERSVTLTYRR